MSFLSHLEHLRWHLIRCTIAILVAGVGAFIAKDFIFGIIFAPKEPSFISYKVLCEISKSIGMGASACITELPFKIQSRTMVGQFNAHIWTAITTGCIVAFPYIMYEMWKFISPALKEKEKKASRGFISVASVLFFFGVVFGYYVLSPLSINFLATYSISNEVHNDIDIGSYMALIRSSVLASGVVFELPVIIYILTKVGLITPKALKKYRRMAIIIILILSAIITPPDVVSQTIVAIPILVLYEVSIFISKAVYKKQQKKHEALMKK